MSPQRIQLSRAQGWRKPAGAIVVSRPSKWGNPITFSDVGAQFPSLDEVQLATMIVRDFAVLAKRGRLDFPNWRFLGGRRGPVHFRYPSIDEIRAELSGHDLCCWCPLDQACHADVLLKIANPGWKP